MTGPAGLRAAAVGLLTARAGLAVTGRVTGARWQRTNFAGRPVSLLGGQVLAAAATGSAVLGAPPGRRAAAAVVGTVAGLVGGYDDLAGARPEQARDKGLAGHLAALRAGRVSAGVVKVVGIGAAAGVAAVLSTDPAALHAPSRAARHQAGGRNRADAVLTLGLVAGTANLVNLLDLRPGRAGKVAVLLAAATVGGPSGGLAAGPLGATAGVLPADLGERVMLGDCGANALGALLGLRLAALPGCPARTALLTVVTALTLASEKVSFTRVIESTPGLRELDQLGRRRA